MRYMHTGLSLNQDQKTEINKTPAPPRLPLTLLTREGKEDLRRHRCTAEAKSCEWNKDWQQAVQPLSPYSKDQEQTHLKPVAQ